MPIVNIDLFEGRTVEQKEAIAKEVTQSIHKNIGAPVETITVIFRDMLEGELYKGGEMRKK